MTTGTPQNPLRQLPGIGPQIEKKLAKLGIYSCQDLLFHLPRTYQDRTTITPIRQCRFGEIRLVEGRILDVEIVQHRRRMLLCHIQDNTSILTARFFHFNQGQYQQMRRADNIRCFGEVRFGKQHLEMMHPEYKTFSAAQALPLEEKLTPIYPTTDGITQNRLRQAINTLLSKHRMASLKELIPEQYLTKLSLPALEAALQFIHQPPVGVNLDQLSEGQHPMQQRLVIEELLAHRLSMRLLRKQLRHIPALQLPPSKTLQYQLCQQLPFSLTEAQQRCIDEIDDDLNQNKAMMRLLQGDVGCGKTLVAAMAILQCVEAGYQAAIMAPTELLATQHLHNLSQWFEPLNITSTLLSSNLKSSEKKQRLTQIADGSVSVVVGTQALFQTHVHYQALALIVVDEQHRFGVDQRRALQAKGPGQQQPHQLIMTATPIPRTLAMTQYADLDISVIDELPPGRQPIQTVLVSDQKRDSVIARIRHNCRQKRQAYWVCPLIETSEALNCQAAEDTAKQLQHHLPELHIGLVHGRMKAEEKAEVMAAFKQGQLDLLVATTVIEVGVDVPNASIMIIDNPERLGLAQLHQLRGRVGRGNTESFCVLLYHPPLSQHAQSRLQTMHDHQDGFTIAEHDLHLRGPGEVLGTRQTGDMQFKVASLLRDNKLLPKVQSIADNLLEQHPECVEPLIQRWIGQRMVYAKV